MRNWARGGAALAVGVLCFATFWSCRRSLTTDTHSSQLSSDREKVEFLAKYLALKSGVQAAEFHVVYRDNSTGIVPGPSDAEVEAVLKVRPADVRLWVSGMQRQEVDGTGRSVRDQLAWGYALLPDAAMWRVSSEPAVFRSGSGSTTVAAFESEGIVMTRVVQH